jgi:hypothetical protein
MELGPDRQQLRKRERLRNGVDRAVRRLIARLAGGAGWTPDTQLNLPTTPNENKPTDSVGPFGSNVSDAFGPPKLRLKLSSTSN